MFKFAVRSVPQVIEKALENAGMQKEQIDWLVMHQVRAMRQGKRMQRLRRMCTLRCGCP